MAQSPSICLGKIVRHFLLAGKTNEIFEKYLGTDLPTEANRATYGGSGLKTIICKEGTEENYLTFGIKQGESKKQSKANGRGGRGKAMQSSFELSNFNSHVSLPDGHLASHFLNAL